MNVRGEYSPTIAYQPMDIVTYQNGSYMAKARAYEQQGDLRR